MFAPISDCRQAPGVGDRILILHNSTSLFMYAAVENKDDTNGASIEWQESDDDSTWNTIVGSSKTINPGQADGQIVASTRRKIALFAQGNVLLNIFVARQYNGDNLTVD